MLLTQNQVAARLRCSLSKVAALRRTGLLKYLPGRPVLIDDADLDRYIEQSKRSGPMHDAQALDTEWPSRERAGQISSAARKRGAEPSLVTSWSHHSNPGLFIFG